MKQLTNRWKKISAKSKADKPRELLKLLAVTSTEGDLLRGLGGSDSFEGVTGSLG